MNITVMSVKQNTRRCSIMFVKNTWALTPERVQPPLDPLLQPTIVIHEQYMQTPSLRTQLVQETRACSSTICTTSPRSFTFRSFRDIYVCFSSNQRHSPDRKSGSVSKRGQRTYTHNVSQIPIFALTSRRVSNTQTARTSTSTST